MSCKYDIIDEGGRKRVISDVSQIAVVDVPPTKTTW